MSRYFLRTLVSHIRQSLSLYALTVFGVALGVASVLSIQIVNHGAIGAFRGSVQAISSEADLSILSKSGAFSEARIVDAMSDKAVRIARPVFKAEVRVDSSPPFRLQIFGLDLAVPSDVRALSDSVPTDGFLRTPGWAAISERLAERMGWNVGTSFGVFDGTRRINLTVGRILEFGRFNPQSSSKIALMDIAQAQDLLGPSGRIHQIDVSLREGASVDRAQDRLASKLGRSYRVVTGNEREEQARNLLTAFRLNLTALSLISLLVGLFLIYSSTQASLLRRRAEFGVLRSLGATRGQVLSLILTETVVLGLLGVAIGLPLGYGVASSNIGVVSATLTNIYLLAEVESLSFPIWFYGLAVVIGVGGALLGTILPALDAARRDPRALLASFGLRERVARLSGALATLGGALLAGSVIWYVTAGAAWKPAGFVLGVALLAALPLMTPLIVKWCCSLAPVHDFGWLYSLRTLGLHIEKTATTVAALSIAAAMLIGITLMIGSFRKTVEVWMEGTVQADVYLTTKGWRRGSSEGGITPEVVEKLRRFPGISLIDRLRSRQVWCGERRISIAGVDVDLPGKAERFPLLFGELERSFREVASDGAVLISEPLYRRLNVAVGDDLRFFAGEEEVALRIAGVYYDYASESGAAIVDLKTFAGLFGEGPPQNIALYLSPGYEAESIVEQLEESFFSQPLTFQSNRSLRRAALRIFDQTFAVVRLLQAMSLLIAVSGVTLSLLILARERVPELALYRALGAKRRQIFRVFLAKGVEMAAMSLALGSMGGVALAAVLIFVINRAYFGWTIQVYWPWTALIQQVVSLLGAAVLAAIYPALRASRTPASELSREAI